MSPENAPSVNETNKRLNRAVWQEMRRPLAAVAVAAVSFFVGNHIDDSHQAHADELSAEFQEGYDDLSVTEQAIVGEYLAGEDLPEGTSQELTDEAEQLKEVSEEQQKEEHAGDLWTLIGQVATFYAGFKTIGVGLSRSIVRNEIRHKHPDLAAKRLKRKSKEFVEFGGFIEGEERFESSYFELGHDADRELLKDEQRRVGRDIETSEPFSLRREELDTHLAKMLNDAQWEAMINDGKRGHNPTEALQLRIIDDLWKPTEETFRSLKDWYSYRKSQVVKPKEVHVVDRSELYMPKVAEVTGGIGVAVSRIGYYMQASSESGQTGDDEASAESLVLAVNGATLLDKLAPREDGTHWFDYIDSFTRSAELPTSN